MGPEPSGNAPLPGDIPAGAPSAEEVATGGDRSLLDDLGNIIEDLQSWIHAELAFQKTRAAFVADRIKKTIALLVVAAVFAVLAAVGLTVGLIIALTPLITAWGATAIVVLALLGLAYVLVKQAGSTWAGMQAAMSEAEQEVDEHYPEPGAHG